MSISKMLLTNLVAVGISLPFAAMATDLTIVNNTNRDSTSIINGGACSDILGEAGITRAHQTNVVNEKTMITACIMNKHNCTAEVHMTGNCSGPKVATVVFDVQTGIKRIEDVPDNGGYVITGNQFTATFNGGPTKNWLQTLLSL